MKREPRLQFSDADLAEPKLEKPIKRVKKAEAKADKAQAKIPKKTVVKKERGFDPATGKVKTQLCFEEVDKKKPPSKLTHAVQDAPANFVLSQVHREVRQSEDDNVGVEAAHKVEQAVESGGRLVQSAHRAHQLKPYRAATSTRRPTPESMTSLRPTALPIKRTRPARKRLKPPSATTTGITGWMQRQSIRWCSSSAMTAHFISLPSPSVKRTGTDAILPTTGLGQTPCPSPPIPTHGVLTATAIWPSAAIPVWSICFSARPAKPTRRSSRKPLSGIC